MIWSAPIRTIVREDAPAAVRVSAADPLNLTGVLLPGPRVSALSGGSVELLPAAGETSAAGCYAWRSPLSVPAGADFGRRPANRRRSALVRPRRIRNLR